MITADNYDPYSFKENLDIDPATKPHRDPASIFWMVVRLGSDYVTKSNTHPAREHSTYEEACAEAERLATKHPTHARGFAVLQAKRIVKAKVSLVKSILQ